MTLTELATAKGRAGLASFLARPDRALLALDFDGTLAPIVDDPEQARPLPAALAALARLAPRLACAAIVTGRPAEVVVPLVTPGTRPGLAELLILGQYGAERWEAGEITSPAPDARIEEARRRLPALLRAVGAPEGVAVEDKGNALAVHARRARDPAGAFAALERPLAELAAERGLRLEPGRYVLELRPPGMDKGLALRQLVAAVRPDCVVFAGDDLGDLAAFDAVDELRAAGRSGLLVCSGSAEVAALRARADLVVDGPQGVATFLEALADALDAGDAPPGAV